MKLLYRLGYYLGGFSVGLIFLAFILNGKKTSCNYTPNARVIDNLLQKEIVIPDAILNSNPQLNTDQIKEIIKRGNVNFSKSDTKRDSCKVSSKIEDLRIGDNQTITVIPQKYSFPRIRNLPNRVQCFDETGQMDCVFFNSFEGYIRKILPLGKNVTISGKVGRFNNKYQITNPKYVSENSLIIKQKHNTYSLTDGISEKIYNKIIDQIINNLPILIK